MKSQYIRTVVSHMGNIVTTAMIFASVGVWILSRFTDSYGDVATALAAAIAVGSIFPASYHTWIEAIEQVPDKADLHIQYNSVVVDSPSEEISPRLPSLSLMQFVIELTGRNTGEDSALFKSLELTKFNMNNALLDDGPYNFKLYFPDDCIEGKDWDQIQYPVEGRGPIFSMQCKISVLFKGDGIPTREFPERLVELDDFMIELSYTFEDMDGCCHTRHIPIEGSFGHFKREVIGYWLQSGNPTMIEWASIAMSAMGITDISQIKVD